MHEQIACITVVTLWIRRPLLQLTMADPVKVIQVTLNWPRSIEVDLDALILSVFVTRVVTSK